MDRATLEILMNDKALGALAPEVANLLEAYLRDHPEMAGESARIDAAVALAARALQATAEHPLPVFPAVRIRQRERALRQWRGLKVGAGIAACITVGFIVGLGVTGREMRDASSGGAMSGGLAEIEPVSESATAQSFWSMPSRPEASAEPGQAAPVIWDSPVRPALPERTVMKRAIGMVFLIAIAGGLAGCWPKENSRGLRMENRRW